MNASEHFDLWWDRALKPVWAAVAAGSVILLVISFWKPQVDPIMPESAFPDLQSTHVHSSDMPEAGNDFVERPLFMTDRRPVEVGEAVVVESGIESTQQAAAIQGVALLGVFSSGGSSGVVVSERGKGQRRLLEGDTLQGWVLSDVNARDAIFINEGRTATLQMEVASQLSQPVPVRSRGDEAAGQEEKSESDMAYVPSFETMYRSKAEDLSRADTTDGTNTAAEQGNGEDEK